MKVTPSGRSRILAEVDADYWNATGPPGVASAKPGAVMVPTCGGGRRPASRVTARM